MKIMVVNNNVMYEKEDGLFLYKETGKFFVDLSQNGNEVTVFQFKMPFVGNDFLADFNICNRGLKIKAIKRRKSKSWAYIKAFLIGFNTIRKSDFVYLFYPGQICIILAFFSLLLRKPYGFYVRGEKGIMSGISKFLYKKAKVVLTISPKFTETINKTGAITETIRPMMDITENDIVHDRVYRKKASYNLLYVGRLEYEKGIFELIEAIQQLVSSNFVKFKLTLVGDGVDASKLKELTKKYKLSEFIIFQGTITNRDKLSNFYKQSDLFIFPSHHEGFPRVLYEAMIFGTPIITTFVGSISYLMKDGYNCLKIEPKDSKGLSLVIKDFFEDFEKKSVIAKNGTKTIINYLSDKKDNHATQLLNLIKHN